MHVKSFKLKHLGHIEAWMHMRNMDRELAYDLPKVGYIVFDSEIAIGVMFLRGVEGGYALIDSAITNPKCSPRLRDEAMALLAHTVIEEAKQQEIKKLLVLSQDKHVIERAKVFGFKEVNDCLLTLKI